MKFSLFTPTHRPEHILELYRSIDEQADTDWEWVILPNGDKPVELPTNIRIDERIRILTQSPKMGIGALKFMLCNACRGEILVEVDHDDILTPDCLSEIRAAHAETNADFFFSDSVTFREDHTSETYDAYYGWENYPFHYNGRDYTAMKSFPVDARSLCEIFYSPNHVRAWTAKAYRQVGGHNVSLAVGDDHELMIRTYLAGCKFHHIPKCLYVYRRYERNECVVNNDAVVKQQTANKNRYLHELIVEWCRRGDLPMLDLGGAHNCPKELGFRSVDLWGADVICDVTEDIPVEDNSIGCFRAYDFLEHIPIPKIIPLMNRLYRKLTPGGWLISATPSVSGPDGLTGRDAFQDPTHSSFFSENNFWYYTDKNFAKYCPQIECRFQAVRLWTEYPSEWHRRHFIPYVCADLHALKGQRAAGPSMI